MTPAFEQDGVTIYRGTAARLPLADGSVQMCVTSPPYWLQKDYEVEGQLGHEATPEAYVAALVEVCREVRRVLRPDGTLWLNLGDSWANWAGARSGRFGRGKSPNIKKPKGLKEKDLIGLPWMVAFALRADGWYLRQENIWHKPGGSMDNATDRPARKHEHVFLFSRSHFYLYNIDAVREPSVYVETPDGGAKLGQNMGSVWTIQPESFGGHPAPFPGELAERCILAGSREADTVLDPFNGSGTTGEVCRKWGRRYVGMELNPDYIELSKERFRQQIMFGAAV